MQSEISFKKVDTGIIEYYRQGWGLITGSYWLFFGITVLGMILAGFAPLGVLMGPLFCGIYLCYIKKDLGEPVTFGLLFEGFEYFLESFIATLIMLLGSLIISLPFIFLIIGGGIGVAYSAEYHNETIMIVSIVFLVISMIIFMVATAIITFPFHFALILILERNMKAWPAFKAGLAGTWLNLGKILLLYFTVMILFGVFMLFCYIPVFLICPLFFGVIYSVFRDISGTKPALPPPPVPV